MKIEIIELAQQELEDAVLFYEVAQSGLGRRFKKDRDFGNSPST
jgi:hypothetical protein